MKKVICILVVILLTFSMVSCKTESGTKGMMTDSTSDQLVSKVQFPVPKTLTYEESNNNLGARFNFTLEEFNTMLNKASLNLSDNKKEEFFNYDNWAIMSENLVDDRGIEYTSYYYSTDTLTLVATVENDSKKVMNIGCGETYQEFVAGDADHQYTVMLTAAIISMVAGGYTKEDIEFLYCIYFDAAKNSEQFYYHNCMYMMDLSKAEGEEGSVVLFMTSPCAEKNKEEWELTDYSSFDGSYIKNN